MEFVIKQSVLKEELGFVQGIVEKKSTIPVLSNILIESVGENAIRFVGTDLDVTIRQRRKRVGQTDLRQI
jgi:DNA polymerase III subunit beta